VLWHYRSAKPHSLQVLSPHRSQALYPPLSLHVGQTPLQDEQTRCVSVIEAMQTRGKVLPVVLGVAAVDIALATYFWGVYVPFYAEKEPAH